MKNIFKKIFSIQTEDPYNVIMLMGFKIKIKNKKKKKNSSTQTQSIDDFLFNKHYLKLKGLELLKIREHSGKQKRIAIFSSVPPADSGVSVYTLKTHETMPLDYDIITEFNNVDELNSALSYSPTEIKNVFPYEIYENLSTYSDYIGKVFIFGNSNHHSFALREAIRTRGEKNRYLFLHEPLLTELWRTYCQEKGFEFANFLKQYYPQGVDDVNSLIPYYPRGISDIYGVVPIIELTGIKNIFVHNEGAKQLLLKDLPDYIKKEIKINVLFLPSVHIENVKPVKLKSSKNEYIVGSFGMPALTKSSTDIVEAIYLLRKSGLNVKLLMAGYFVKNFISNLPPKYHEFIIGHNNLQEEEMYKYMKSVDLAVQLRPKHHGDVSACIAELLGLEIKVISTENYLPQHFERYCHVVPSFIPVRDLAETIKEELFKKEKINTDDLVNNYNFKTLAQLMQKIIIERKEDERILENGQIVNKGLNK